MTMCTEDDVQHPTWNQDAGKISVNRESRGSPTGHLQGIGEPGNSISWMPMRALGTLLCRAADAQFPHPKIQRGSLDA